MPPKSLYFNEAAENLPIEVKFSDGTLGTAFPTKYRKVYDKFQFTPLPQNVLQARSIWLLIASSCDIMYCCVDTRRLRKLIIGKHINRYYIRYALWLLFGLAALVLVDFLQLR